jgi:regulatory protein
MGFVLKKSSRKARERNLSPEDRRRRIFERAVKLLAAKPRSIAELRDRLLEGQYATKALVEEVIGRFREYGYLDDERFAFSYASSKLRLRPTGRRLLARDLSLKKVDPALADEALNLIYSETSEEELIDRAIEKRMRVRGRPRNRAEAKSLFDHLLRQGFPFELVSDKVRAASTAEIDE